MKRVLLLDVTAPKPYDLNTLQTEPQGGTESTVTRIAEGLAARGHQVYVGQKCRSPKRQEYTAGSVAYLPIESANNVRPDVVIGLRKADWNWAHWPNAKRIVWLHDFNQNELVNQYDAHLKGKGVKLVCVSRTHKTAVISEFLTRIGVVEGMTVTHVYNPIADDLLPDSTPVDPKKLVFFSSPHKGLEHALYLFSRLRDVDPAYTLHVANPGYLPSPALEVPGVVPVGALNHASVVSLVRSAGAVFHPNLVFPETFGLVHAEANAVGTPVITSILGANREVLGSHPVQTLDVRNEKLVIETLQSWARERPAVKGREEFRLSNVLNEWERLL